MSHGYVEFELDLNMHPVCLKGNEGEKWIAASELTGTQKDSWLNDLGKRQRVHDKTGTVSGIKNFTNIQAGMLGMVTYHVDCEVSEDPQTNEKTVEITHVKEKLSIQEIQELPARIQNYMFDWVQRASGISKDEEEPGDDSGN